MIWQICLPSRVDELDVAHGDAYYSDDPAWPLCTSDTTSSLNVKPPLLTRVYREARDVALKTGTFRPDEDCHVAESSWRLPRNLHVGNVLGGATRPHSVL
jgi:hypothetical protein